MEAHTAVKTSIRCDQHPPMSATMYCETCKAFLCKICAVVKPGGRVCGTCQKTVVEVSGDELVRLLEERKRAEKSAREIKEATAKLKEQSDKSRQDREARLKAEFAAKKAELLEKEKLRNQQAVNIASMGSAARPGVAPVSQMPGQTPPTLGGTLAQVEADPLKKLGERSHINVIGRAKTGMLIIGIITLLANAFWMFSVNEAERQMHQKITADREEKITQLESEIRKTKNKEEKKELVDELNATKASEGITNAIGTGIFFIFKAVLGAYLAVGALLVVLSFMCDQYPRAATTTAFIVYLLLNMISLLFFWNILGIILRWGMLVQLYRGMVAGHTLHEMRTESGEVVA